MCGTLMTFIWEMKERREFNQSKIKVVAFIKNRPKVSNSCISTGEVAIVWHLEDQFCYPFNSRTLLQPKFLYCTPFSLINLNLYHTTAKNFFSLLLNRNNFFLHFFLISQKYIGEITTVVKNRFHQKKHTFINRLWGHLVSQIYHLLKEIFSYSLLILISFFGFRWMGKWNWVVNRLYFEIFCILLKFLVKVDIPGL